MQGSLDREESLLFLVVFCREIKTIRRIEGESWNFIVQAEK
jgi:hypothetical protein